MGVGEAPIGRRKKKRKKGKGKRKRKKGKRKGEGEENCTAVSDLSTFDTDTYPGLLFEEVVLSVFMNSGAAEWWFWY